MRWLTPVRPYPAGAALYDEGRLLLKQADRLRERVKVAAGAATLTIGTLADSAEQVGGRWSPPSTGATRTWR